jgi:hypothetical protein
MRKLKLGLCLCAVVALGATPAIAAPPAEKQEAICAKHAGKDRAPKFCEEEVIIS